MKTNMPDGCWRGLVLATTATIVTLFASAAIPPGYYSPIDGHQAAALKAALSKLLQDHIVLEYDSLWSLFVQTDTRQDGTIWDMYSDRKQKNFRGMNREHAFPKSWWGGSINAAYSDLHHLFPADWEANRAKNNNPLGLVGVPVFDNGVSKVGYDRYGGQSSENLVFEPADAYKGDFARAYFYVVTCYQELTWIHTFMVETNAYPTLKPDAIRLLMDWHRNDPVSTKERLRNEVVYAFQGNRNPFVDYPELASYLWGDSTSYAFSLKGREGTLSDQQPLRVYANRGVLYLQATRKDLDVTVYHPLGIRMSHLTTTGTLQQVDNLAPGIYVVTCLGSTWKVVVK